jgi:hypothetical protein
VYLKIKFQILTRLQLCKLLFDEVRGQKNQKSYSANSMDNAYSELDSSCGWYIRNNNQFNASQLIYQMNVACQLIKKYTIILRWSRRIWGAAWSNKSPFSKRNRFRAIDWQKTIRRVGWIKLKLIYIKWTLINALLHL